MHLNLILLLFYSNALQDAYKIFPLKVLVLRRTAPTPLQSLSLKNLGNCGIKCGHNHNPHLVKFENTNDVPQAHLLYLDTHSNWKFYCTVHYIYFLLIRVRYLIAILSWCGYQHKQYFFLLLEYWFYDSFARGILWRIKWLLSFRREKKWKGLSV